MVYASIGKRFIALIIDWAALSIIIGLLSAIFGIGSADQVQAMMSTGDYTTMAGFFASSGIIRLLYFTLMESSKHQATFGKMALGMKVVRADGGRISMGKAILRYFGKWLSGLILGIGYIMAAFTDKKRALHDMIASTLVVRADSLEQIS